MGRTQASHKIRKRRVIFGSLGKRVVALALIPNYTGDSVIINGSQEAVVEISSLVFPVYVGVIFAVGCVKVVAIVLFCQIVRQEGNERRATLCDLHKTYGYVGILLGKMSCKVVSNSREGEGVSLVGLCPGSGAVKLGQNFICTKLGVSIVERRIETVKSDYGIGVDRILTAALSCRIIFRKMLLDLVLGVGLTHYEINVANENVCELYFPDIGVYLHLCTVYVGFKTGGEGDAPFAILDQCLGKHALEGSGHLFSVLAFGGKSPNADMLTSLHYHVVGEDPCNSKAVGVFRFKRFAYHNVGYHFVFTLTFGVAFFGGRALGGIGIIGSIRILGVI